MDKYKELKERIASIAGNVPKVSLYQGTVVSTEGLTCTVRLGTLTVPGVRLRATMQNDSEELRVTPAIGSAVIVGSLSGDLNSLVLITCDKVQSITINGGSLGGLVNIQELTSALNSLVQTFNSHTHPCPNGTTSVATQQAQTFKASDYEDTRVKH